MQFYRKLSTLRKEAGLSQEQLAEKAGVSRQTIFKWEAGLASPSMENILALCRIFGVSADELIGNETPEEKTENEIYSRTAGCFVCPQTNLSATKRLPPGNRRKASEKKTEERPKILRTKRTKGARLLRSKAAKKQVVNTLPPSFFLVFIMNTRASGPCSDFRSSIFMWERASIRRRESLR